MEIDVFDKREKMLRGWYACTHTGISDEFVVQYRNKRRIGFEVKWLGLRVVEGW